jgi:hypothetical protein
VEVENSLDKEFDTAQTPHLPTEEKVAEERARKRTTKYVTYIIVQVKCL